MWYTATKSLTLNLGKYTITGNLDKKAVLRIYSSIADTVIDFTIEATTGGISNAGTGYAIYAGEDVAGSNDEERTNLTINGGNYMTNGNDCIQQILGLCTINGGTYKSSFSRTVLKGVQWYGSEFAINGGSFYGFNPACVSVWTGFNGQDYTNFYHQHDIIAEGKTATLDENGWYTVVDGTFSPKVETKSLCYPNASVAVNAITAMNDVANLGLITLLADDELSGVDAKTAYDNGFTFTTGDFTLWLPADYSLANTTAGKLTQNSVVESDFETTTDSGYYGVSGTPESGIIAFNSFYSKYETANVNQFGLYIYVTCGQQIKVDAADIDELKAASGEFYTTVSDIQVDDFKKYVFAVPFVDIDGTVQYGKTVGATVNTEKWLGEIE